MMLCKYTLCILFLCPYTTGLPLIPQNVVMAVEKVRWWWGYVCGCALAGSLYIPKSKQDDIRANFPDKMEQKVRAIAYWINNDPLASWRRLIRALDVMRKTKLADSIRPNAELLTGIVTIYN